MATVMDGKALAARVGEAGREFVKMEWSRERFAANMARAYEDVLGLREGKSLGAGNAHVAARGEAG